MSSLHALSSRVDQGSGSSTRLSDMRIVMSMPSAKNRLTTSAGSPETCSARSTRLRQALRVWRAMSGSSHEVHDLSISIKRSRSCITSVYVSHSVQRVDTGLAFRGADEDL